MNKLCLILGLLASILLVGCGDDETLNLEVKIFVQDNEGEPSKEGIQIYDVNLGGLSSNHGEFKKDVQTHKIAYVTKAIDSNESEKFAPYFEGIISDLGTTNKDGVLASGNLNDLLSTTSFEGTKVAWSFYKNGMEFSVLQAVKVLGIISDKHGPEFLSENCAIKVAEAKGMDLNKGDEVSDYNGFITQIKFFEKVPNINANDYNDHERAQKVIDSLKVQSLEMVFKKQSARTRALGYFSSVDIADGDTVIKSPSAVWIDEEDEQFFSISY